jgi:chromosome segregation ATPase
MGYTKSRRDVKRQQPNGTRRKQHGGDHYDDILVLLEGPYADIIQTIMANSLQNFYHNNSEKFTRALQSDTNIQKQIITAYNVQVPPIAKVALIEEKQSPKRKSASSPLKAINQENESSMNQQLELKRLKTNYMELEKLTEQQQNDSDAKITFITKALAASEAKVKACETNAAKQEEILEGKLASVQARIQVDLAKLQKELDLKQATVDDLKMIIKQLEGDLSAAEEANKLLSNSISPEQYEVAMRNIESKVREQFEAYTKQHQREIKEKQGELKTLNMQVSRETTLKNKLDADLFKSNNKLQDSQQQLHDVNMKKAGLQREIDRMEKYAQHLNSSIGVIPGLKALAGFNKVDCTVFPNKDLCDKEPTCYYEVQTDKDGNDISECVKRRKSHDKK